MKRDRLEGVLLHIPVGAFQVFLAWLNPALGIAFCVGFIAYELNEDMHLKDNGWVDIAGYLWGIALGGVGWAIVKVLF